MLGDSRNPVSLILTFVELLISGMLVRPKACPLKSPSWERRQRGTHSRLIRAATKKGREWVKDS